MLDGILAGISASHFQMTRCLSFENTSMKAFMVCSGIEETGTKDPNVKMIKPSLAPSAKVLKF